jgi:4-aminobutyrate aminotransferase
MITERGLAALSYADMPKIVTNDFPGPKARRIIEDAIKVQSPTRPSVRGTLVIEEGKGAGIKDPDGNILIDLSAGVAVSSVGRNHPLVVDAIKRQSARLMHSAGLVSRTTVALARKLSSVMPEGLRGECFTWFGMSGSAAVETAIKYARAITGRSQIVAFEGAYHGVFHGSLALTTREAFRAPYRPFMPDAIHMPYAYCYRCFAGLQYPGCGIACAKYFDYKLTTPNTGADDVAAVIVEPMQADGGYIDPPVEFIRALRETCSKKGILLIADEVQAGGGRTGKMWSIEHYGVVPDMLVWAKAIGGDMPLSGLTVHNRYYDKLPPASQVITAAENALANVVALTNIEILSDRNADLIARCAIVGDEIKQHITQASKTSAIIDQVRGPGFFIGIELVADKRTRAPLDTKVMNRIVQRCERRGVRVMTCGRYGSTIRLMPPLVITREHLHMGTDILLEAIRESEGETVKEAS